MRALPAFSILIGSIVVATFAVAVGSDAPQTQRMRQQPVTTLAPVASLQIGAHTPHTPHTSPALNAPWGPFAPTREELLQGPLFMVTPEPLPALAPASVAGATLHLPAPIELVDSTPLYITLEQLDVYAAEAGWSGEAWQLMRRIIVECECPSLNVKAHNSSDPHGGSHGLAQLNGSYWFERYGEDFSQRYDPVVNLRTARKLYEERGRFGGGGGWSCADRLGIP